MDQEENPYRPPSSPVRDMNQMRAAGLAGKWRRFGTFVVDYLCFLVVGFIVGVAVALIFGRPGIVAMQRIPNMISGSVLFACYYVVFEGIWSLIALLVQLLAYFLVHRLLPHLPRDVADGKLASGVFLGATAISFGLLSAACMSY